MKNFGFLRVAACSPEVSPADIDFNVDHICGTIEECIAENADMIVFPELSVTGYTCADLFDQSLLIEKAYGALREIAERFSNEQAVIVAGTPVRYGNRLFNCGAVIRSGEILGFVPKSYIPNYGEFYEKRWFASGRDLKGEIKIDDTVIPIGTDLLFEISDIRFGIEICEDLWAPVPPSLHNASAGAGESSTDLAFAGNCIIAENGAILAASERFVMRGKKAIADLDIESLRHDRQHFNTFSEYAGETNVRLVRLGETAHRTQDVSLIDYRKIKAHPFLDENAEDLKERCDEISSIQAWGLATRLKAINCRHAVIGISGGLDSTLALLVTAKAFKMLDFDPKGITGVTMPGFGTTDRTKNNASKLMDLLGVTQREIPIGAAVLQHFEDIGHNPDVHDVTYENSQARERTQILMDIANQKNGIVIGTGDLSELALGWCTYNGDQMSMYGVNASIPKTLVRYLVQGYAENSNDPELTRVLEDIIDTPISPELLPPDKNDSIKQKTEDLVGPYELHDFFLYHILRYGMEPRKIMLLASKAFTDRYDKETIRHWLKTFYRRFFNQQFKRSCMPDGVKAGSVCLSPRGDWRMPSDASSALWISEANKI